MTCRFECLAMQKATARFQKGAAFGVRWLDGFTMVYIMSHSTCANVQVFQQLNYHNFTINAGQNWWNENRPTNAYQFSARAGISQWCGCVWYRCWQHPNDYPIWNSHENITWRIPACLYPHDIPMIVSHVLVERIMSSSEYSMDIMVYLREIIPKWPYFRLVKYCDLPR